MQEKTYTVAHTDSDAATGTKPNSNRLCCVCDKKLYGRSDKVFCDIHCKNKYHQDIRKQTKSVSANTVKILKNNYVILCGLLGDNCDRYIIKKLKLQEMGFNFEIISGMSKNPYGLKMDLFELSWYYTTNNNIVVMKNPGQTLTSPYMYKRWERHMKQLQTNT